MTPAPKHSAAAHKPSMDKNMRIRSHRGLLLAVILFVAAVAVAAVRIPLGLVAGIDPLFVAALVLFASGGLVLHLVTGVAERSVEATLGR
jgi:hypothetical protein